MGGAWKRAVSSALDRGLKREGIETKDHRDQDDDANDGNGKV